MKSLCKDFTVKEAWRTNIFEKILFCSENFVFGRKFEDILLKTKNFKMRICKRSPKSSKK